MSELENSRPSLFMESILQENLFQPKEEEEIEPFFDNHGQTINIAPSTFKGIVLPQFLSFTNTSVVTDPVSTAPVSTAPVSTAPVSTDAVVRATITQTGILHAPPVPSTSETSVNLESVLNGTPTYLLDQNHKEETRDIRYDIQSIKNHLDHIRSEIDKITFTIESILNEFEPI